MGKGKRKFEEQREREWRKTKNKTKKKNKYMIHLERRGKYRKRMKNDGRLKKGVI